MLRSRKMTSAGNNSLDEGLIDEANKAHEHGACDPLTIGIEKELETLHIQPPVEMDSRDYALAALSPTLDESTEFMDTTAVKMESPIKTFTVKQFSGSALTVAGNSGNLVDVDRASRFNRRLGRKCWEYNQRSFERPKLLSQRSKSIRKQECFPRNSILSSRYKNMGVRMKRIMAASTSSATEDDFEYSEELCHVFRNPLQ